MKIKVGEIDLKLFNSIFHFKRDSFLPRFFRVISFIGDGYFYPLLLLCMYFVEPSQFKAVVLTSVIAFTLELPIYFILKNTIKRDRPFNAHKDIQNMVYPIDEYSFPSGHTTAAFLVAFIMCTFLPMLAPILYTFAVLVGLSRIYLGVHYPGDILAGAFFGTFIGVMAVLVFGMIV